MHRTITFRLKSSSYVGTVEMENSVMACREVQEAIAAKLCAPVEEIQVFLANSTALLHPEETIAMFSVVDVVRQVSLGKPSNPKSASVTAVSTASALGSAATMSGLDANTSLTEEERLAQLKAEISLDTGMNEVGRGGGGGGRGGRGRGRGGANGMPFMMNADSFKPPPKGYVCHNCGKGGHKIEHCPASRNGRNLKALSFAIGIPESMLEECSMDDPASKFITKDYRIVKRRMDPSAFTGVLPATAEAETPANAEEGCGDGANADDDLELEPYQCILDGVVAKEAMKVPCCGRLLCRSCYDSIVQKALTRDHDDESDDEELGLCPSCKEPLCFEDVVDAVEERDKITALLSNRKRKRS